MVAIVIPNAAQLKVRWTGGARSWMNVIGCIGNPALPTINQALIDALFTSLKGQPGTTTLLSMMAPTTSLVSISIRDLSAANRAEFTSTGAAAPGTGTGDPLPYSAAACVTIRTAGAGKSFRGRVYISGWNETQNDATGRIVTAANTAASGFVSAIDNALQTQQMFIGVLSMPRDAKTIPAKTIAAKGGFVTGRTGFEVRNTKWESQRRRTGRT